jgi:tartrate dehydratase beta subunit/fumarate hydratase class I family protein
MPLFFMVIGVLNGVFFTIDHAQSHFGAAQTRKQPARLSLNGQTIYYKPDSGMDK